MKKRKLELLIGCKHVKQKGGGLKKVMLEKRRAGKRKPEKTYSPRGGLSRILEILLSNFEPQIRTGSGVAMSQSSYDVSSRPSARRPSSCVHPMTKVMSLALNLVTIMLSI